MQQDDTLNLPPSAIGQCEHYHFESDVIDLGSLVSDLRCIMITNFVPRPARRLVGGGSREAGSKYGPTDSCVCVRRSKRYASEGSRREGEGDDVPADRM